MGLEAYRTEDLAACGRISIDGGGEHEPQAILKFASLASQAGYGNLMLLCKMSNIIGYLAKVDLSPLHL